ncbi:MAG: hypothetical protein J5548_12575 [Prevotella sp.]|nr:hypothetical protein [Prevotella sp.]
MQRKISCFATHHPEKWRQTTAIMFRRQTMPIMFRRQTSMFRAKIGCASTIKIKNGFFVLYCLRLAQLCPSGEDRLRLGKENKNFVIYFAFHSACTIFAFEKRRSV